MTIQDKTPENYPDKWSAELPTRLAQQFQFLIEAEQLRGILRNSPVSGGKRKENSAEHSWHLVLFAAVLSEWSNEAIEINRVMLMLLIHDLIEIDAGDVSIFDETARAQQEEHEARAAERLFGLLPADQGAGLKSLWLEFEHGETAEARFARALDRLQPILLNHVARGGTWAEHDVDETRERRLTGHIAEGSSTLWNAAEAIFREAVDGGWMSPASEDTRKEEQ